MISFCLAKRVAVRLSSVTSQTLKETASMYEDDDIDINCDIPECEVPEVIEVFDFCDHCDDDAPAPEMV